MATWIQRGQRVLTHLAETWEPPSTGLCLSIPVWDLVLRAKLEAGWDGRASLRAGDLGCLDPLLLGHLVWRDGSVTVFGWRGLRRRLSLRGRVGRDSRERQVGRRLADSSSATARVETRRRHRALPMLLNRHPSRWMATSLLRRSLVRVGVLAHLRVGRRVPRPAAPTGLLEIGQRARASHVGQCRCRSSLAVVLTTEVLVPGRLESAERGLCRSLDR